MRMRVYKGEAVCDEGEDSGDGLVQLGLEVAHRLARSVHAH